MKKKQNKTGVIQAFLLIKRKLKAYFPRLQQKRKVKNLKCLVLSPHG